MQHRHAAGAAVGGGAHQVEVLRQRRGDAVVTRYAKIWRRAAQPHNGEKISPKPIYGVPYYRNRFFMYHICKIAMAFKHVP